MDERLQSEICARIKQARIEAGFTLQEAADTLGVTLRAWQNYEATRVPFRSLTRIADITGVSEAWLLRGEGEGADASALADILRRLESLEDQVMESNALTLRALGLLELLAAPPVVAAPPTRKRASG